MLKISFKWTAIALIIIAVFGIYANTLHSPFIWDDEEIVVNNQTIKTWKNLPEMFRTDVFGENIETGSFYRPLQIFSYSIDYYFWKLNPTGYHISNIFLHTLNALLALCFLIKIGMKKNLAFLTALIFAIHPINIEAVTYISGRGDLMFLFFSMLCFIAFINTKEKKSQYLASIIFFILAIFSKESALVLPFIILIYYFLFLKNKNKKYALATSLILSGIAFLYAGARFMIMGIEGSGALSIINEASLWHRILTVPRIIITYIQLIVFPKNLHMEYLFLEKSITSPYVFAGTGFILIMIFVALKYIKPAKLSAFFLGWFFIGLGLFYNIFPALSSSLREHWAYLSIIGFSGLMVLTGYQIFQSNKKYLKFTIVLLFIFLIIYYAFTTINRNKDWDSAIALYTHDLKYEPKSFLLHNNLGVIYFRAKEIQKAKQSFLNSINTSPRKAYDVAHNNLGAVLEKEGNIEAAILAYQKSIELGDYELAYNNLGKAYLKQEKISKAINILEQGMLLYPNSFDIYYYLGVGYFYQNRFAQAYKIFTNIENSYPEFEDVRYYLEKIRQGGRM